MNGDASSESRYATDAERLGEARRLDGNAAAGILSEVFAADLTTARATCANCGTTRTLGAVAVYAHGMGTVMRCSDCDAVILRVARTPAHVWLDLTGATGSSWTQRFKVSSSCTPWTPITLPICSVKQTTSFTRHTWWMSPECRAQRCVSC